MKNTTFNAFYDSKVQDYIEERLPFFQKKKINFNRIANSYPEHLSEL